MVQLLIHLWADYVCQSSWMAVNKSKATWPCFVHVLIYTACFLVLTTSWKALLVIGLTHFLIDRFSLAKYVIYLKEQILNPEDWCWPWKYCRATGYFDQIETIQGTKVSTQARPLFISVWLYIITDNLFHLTINYLALKYL